MQLEPWDFIAVYFDAIDHFGHGFMRYHPPRQTHIPEKDFEIFKGVVEGGYRYHDMMLEVLLELAGEDTTVILISDHGFHPDHLRPKAIPLEPAGPAAKHRPYGIVVMKGPGIRKDERIYGATLLDIAPTILTLFGLPVGEDMDGKPLVQAFEKPPPINTIESWKKVDGNSGMHTADKRMNPVEAREAIKQLVALGYIEEPGQNQELAMQSTIRESRYNLAQDYMDANRHAEARPILEELCKERPDDLRFSSRLATCLHRLGLLPKCRKQVEELIKTRNRLALEARKKLAQLAKKKKELEKKKKDLTVREKRQTAQLRTQVNPGRFGVDYIMGTLLFAEGDHEKALKSLQRAEKAEPRLPDLHIQIGYTYLKMKKWSEAERSFEKAIKIDQDSAQAHLGLCLSCLARRRALASRQRSPGRGRVDVSFSAGALQPGYRFAPHRLYGEGRGCLQGDFGPKSPRIVTWPAFTKRNWAIPPRRPNIATLPTNWPAITKCAVALRKPLIYTNIH